MLPRLRHGGLLVADDVQGCAGATNTLWSGKVFDPKEKSDYAIVAFNFHVARDRRVDQVLLGVRDGVMLVRRK